MIDAHQWVLLRRCRGARNRPGCQPPPATCLHARCQAQTVAGPAACSHARPGQGSGRAGARAALHELAHHIRAGATGGPQQGSRLLHQGGAGVDGARHAGCRVPTAQPARSAPAVSPERQARGGAAMPGGRAAPEVSRPPRRSRAPFCGRRSAPGPRAARRAAVRVRTACAAAPARARPSRPQAGGRAAGRARGRASGAATCSAACHASNATWSERATAAAHNTIQSSPGCSYHACWEDITAGSRAAAPCNPMDQACSALLKHDQQAAPLLACVVLCCGGCRRRGSVTGRDRTERWACKCRAAAFLRWEGG